MSPSATSDHTATARRALEDVCSGKDLGGIPDVYHSDFVDHVNALEYQGHEGARRSVALYLELFPDLRWEHERATGWRVTRAGRSTWRVSRSKSPPEGRPFEALGRTMRASSDGRGWFRTSDLSRVKRALSH